MRVRLEAPGRNHVEGQPQLRDRLLSLRDLGGAHLREVLAAQHLVARHGKARIDLDLGHFARRPVFLLPLEQRLADAVFGGTRLHPLAPVGSDRRKHRQHLLDQFARLPVKAKRLVEDGVVLMARNQHGMQRPVEIVAVADAGRQHRLDGVLDGSRADPHAGLAQRSREIDDVVGHAAFGRHLVSFADRIRHGVYSAAASSALTSSRMRRPSPWPMRAMSS